MSWQVYGLLSAIAAGATAVLAKIGIEGVPSNLATAIQTVVILAFVSAIVAARGEYRALAAISPRALLFLGLSGCATGLAWLAYFRAVQIGPAAGDSPHTCRSHSHCRAYPPRGRSQSSSKSSSATLPSAVIWMV